MILRNPAAMRDSFFRFILPAILLCLTNHILHAQGLSGMVLEEFSRQPIVGARVQVSSEDVLIYNTTTDAHGRYTYTSIKAGRVEVSIIVDGYANLLIKDIILDGYTTQRLDHFLEKNAFDLPDVTVVANRRDPGSFVRTITPDDMVLVAGNFEDPVRIAHSQPGIVLLNDQANHISLRGKSPIFNTWYLEGLEIVNPNHTNNAGTLSDLPTTYGGGINMFSAQMLASTNIYTGINPMHIKDISGAVIDMHLHESEKPEWRAKAGLLGFEIGGGTSIGSHSILDVNLRYSFTGLLANLGVDFGGEKIGFYDGVVSFKNTGARHALKVFAFLGRSENEFDSLEVTEVRERYKDFFNIDYSNDLAGVGLRYDASLSQKIFLRSGFAFSSNSYSYMKRGQFEAGPVHDAFENQQQIISAFTSISLHHTSRLRTSLGVEFNSKTYEDVLYYILPFPEEKQIRSYVQMAAYLTPALKIEAGADISRSFDEEDYRPEQGIPGYNAVVTLKTAKQHALNAGIRHGRGNPQYFGSNRNFFRSTNYELGYLIEGKTQRLHVNVYYQKMQRMIVHYLILTDSIYDYVYLADFPFISEFLIFGQNGSGFSNHIGIEAAWSYRGFNGWRLDINQSLNKSDRGGAFTFLENGRYDSRFATHFLIAKEFIKERGGKNRIWNFSLRGLFHGGLWEPAILESISDIEEKTVYVFPAQFNQRLPMFKRIDAGLSRTIAYEKVRWRYSLDIQNVLGLTNVAYRYYDPFLNEIKDQEHLGIIPVLSIQASW